MFEWLFKYSPAYFEEGEFLFASGWPPWLLAGLIAAVAVALYLDVRRRRAALRGGRALVIWSLQAAFAALVLVLLWQPALGIRTLRAQDNVVAVMLDTSGSMTYGEGEQSRLQQAVATLEAGALPALEREFGVRLYAFSEDATRVDSLQEIPPPGPSTHLAASLLQVLQEARTQSLGAVVVLSDGADNSGNLTSRLGELAGFGVPIHTVGVGREQLPEDLELDEVVVAPRTMPGSRVSAQLSIRHGAGVGVARVKAYDGEAILASRELELPAEDGISSHWIDFDAGESGLKDLRFTLEPLPGERNTINNAQARVMDVPAESRKVLYVEGEPRWEYKFIRRAAETDPSLRLVTLLRTTPNKYYRQGIDSPDELVDGLPLDRETLFEYDALVLGSLEAAALTSEQQEMIRDFVGERGGSLLMLGGRRGLSDGGWGSSEVAEALPAHLPSVSNATFVRTPAKVALTAEGVDAAITRLDEDPGENWSLWNSMPAVADFQHLGNLKPAAVTLLELENTRAPLLLTQRYGRGESYILATGGTWRWRMHLPHQDTRHEAFWRQLLRAMVTQVPRKVLLGTDSQIYADRTQVAVRVEVRNAAYERLDDASHGSTESAGRGQRGELGGRHEHAHAREHGTSPAVRRDRPPPTERLTS